MVLCRKELILLDLSVLFCLGLIRRDCQVVHNATDRTSLGVPQAQGGADFRRTALSSSQPPAVFSKKQRRRRRLE